MAKVLSYSQALKGWFLMIIAILVLLFGGQLAELLTRDPNASVLIRSTGVAVAVIAIVPWILIIVRAIGFGDEFVRQVAIVGTAMAFVADLIVHVGFEAAARARLVSWGTHLLPIPLAIGLWLLGITVAALYYRYRA